MDTDFDKQIDTILRDLAKGNSLAESPPVSHLDSDELSAFAENALPQKARLRAMEHLADCQKCRKFLSTFALLSEEVESVTVQEEIKTIAAIPEIPWYRQLFAFPAISYAMGAMALLLVGMVGFLVLQSSQDKANSVAMSEPTVEKVKGPSSVSSDGEAPVSETYSSNSANAASNIAMPTVNAASSTANSVSNSMVSSANTVATSEPKPTAAPLALGSPTPSAPMSADKPAVSAERDAKKDAVATKGSERESKSANEVASAPAAEKQPMDDNLSQRAETTQNVQNRATQNQIMTPDGSNEARRSMPSAPPMAKKREDTSSGGEGATVNKAEPKTSSTKTVAGKTFSNEKGVWTDSAYKGGSTTNVKRGTNDYKKLDSGLRSTADYLGGTVVIVWKGKNYKIQ
jgi:hypothetical protein